MIVVMRGRGVIWVGVLRRHVERGLRSETSNDKRFINTERKLMRKRRRFQMISMLFTLSSMEKLTLCSFSPRVNVP